MKLQVFNKANCQRIKAGKPTFTLNQSIGTMTISKDAKLMMGYKELDEVAIAYDSENNEWYIYKVKQDGFKLRNASGVKSSLIFNNRKVVDSIGKHLEDRFFGRNGRMLIGSERIIGDNGEEYWPIIITSFKTFKNS